MKYLFSLVAVVALAAPSFACGHWFVHREVTINGPIFGKRTHVLCVGPGCPKCRGGNAQEQKSAAPPAAKAPAKPAAPK